jgi:hypothetical protein
MTATTITEGTEVMLELTIAYVHQADREETIEAALRARQLLASGLEREPDTTPAVTLPVVTDRPAGRRAAFSRPAVAPGR